MWAGVVGVGVGFVITGGLVVVLHAADQILVGDRCRVRCGAVHGQSLVQSEWSLWEVAAAPDDPGASIYAARGVPNLERPTGNPSNRQIRPENEVW
jgi:hypothetical protein